MSILTITVDTADIYDENTLEDAIRRAVTSNLKDSIAEKLAEPAFKQVEAAAVATAETGVRERLMSFLDEEIALTDQWGKKTFVGSMDDLIKAKFDEALLHPVNENGQKLVGCTSNPNTWIQWTLKKAANDTVNNVVDGAKREILSAVKTQVAAVLEEFKSGAIKKQVSETMADILRAGK